MGVSTEGGILRRGSDRMLGGVCAGLARYFGVDVVFVRVAFVALAFLPPGVGIWLYLALWILMAPPEDSLPPAGNDLRSRLRMVRQEFRDDWRHWFSRSESTASSGAPPPSDNQPPEPAPGVAPSAPPPATPPPPPPPGWWGPGYGRRPRGIWGGIILIGVGIYFLVANLGYLSWWRWDLFWPVVLIALGLLVLARRIR